MDTFISDLKLTNILPFSSFFSKPVALIVSFLQEKKSKLESVQLLPIRKKSIVSVMQSDLVFGVTGDIRVGVKLQLSLYKLINNI